MTEEHTTLEARVRRLEDIEEIRRLKARYCDYCDNGYDPDGIAALYTEDGVWDGGRTFGRREGRDAIRRHFQGAAGRISIARHQVMNPIIDIGSDGDPDEATGQWLLFQPCTDAGAAAEPGGSGAMWLAATYRDRYRRVDGRWLFAETVIDIAFFTPYEKGWATEQFLPGREPD
jgi:ketosteroid isomerase-like protein